MLHYYDEQLPEFDTSELININDISFYLNLKLEQHLQLTKIKY